MIFWDSSALVSLLVAEVDSAARGDLLKLDFCFMSKKKHIVEGVDTKRDGKVRTIDVI